jgi:tetratricopeptide (TPR) repeat protein
MNSSRPPVHPIEAAPKTPGGAPAKRTRVTNRVKLPPLTREQRQATEALLPILQAAEDHLHNHQPTQVLELLQHTAPEPPPALPAYEQLRWDWLLGAAYMQPHQPEQARPWLERGLDLGERLRAHIPLKYERLFRELTEHVRTLLGDCLYDQGQPAQALLLHRGCLLAITNGTLTNPAIQLLVYTSLARDYTRLGQPEPAISAFQQTLALAERLQDPRQRALASLGLAHTYHALGQDTRATAAYQQALALFERLGETDQIIPLQALLGHLLIQSQQLDTARQIAERSMEAAAPTNNARLQAIAQSSLAAWQVATGQFENAIHSAQTALALLATAPDDRISGQVYLTQAQAFQHTNTPAAAEQAFQQAIALLQHSADTPLLRHTYEQYGAFLSSQGRFQDAFAQLEAARSLQTSGPAK